MRLLREMAILAVLFAAIPGAERAAATDSGADTMEARVQACASCHGAQGQGTGDAYFPRLAGKPAGYLYNQLMAFRGGRRRYPPMNYLIEYLSPAYLKAMADFFATQRPPLPEPATPDVSKSVLAHGEDLVTHGNSGRSIPACASCHGPTLTGMEPAIPGLLGLRASYISGQLGAWRYGTRTALAPDCMQVVAGHLSEDDVKAIAAYLSSKPTLENGPPAAKGSFVLPFACGSEPD